MTRYITDTEIEQRLLKIENKIKGKNDFSRDDVQKALNAIRGKGLRIEEKKEALKNMIGRTGVKNIGIKTLYTPRQGLKETDKTFEFLSDIKSYRGVLEEEELLTGEKIGTEFTTIK